ncbi:hypothetical protein [Microcoleus sp. D3_18_C4]|uniref:hypothetical protein n=1 Tax=Microcoleus sp. D3_18_C4 TaxID=3055335 RepID=UPI002FD5E7A1
MKIIKQAMEVRLGPPQAVMFLSRTVKGTKLKAEAIELLGKLAPTTKVWLFDESLTEEQIQDLLMFGRTASSLWEPENFGFSP